MAENERETGGVLAAEDMLRAGMYRLLAALLGAAPGGEELRNIKDLTGDPTPLGQAIAALAAKARESDPATIAKEFKDVFEEEGLGEPPTEVVPFASFYLTGVNQSEPSAQLRRDMERLGIEGDPAVGGPEDHIASLLEMMAGSIDGSFGEPLPLSDQKSIYEQHVACWMPDFFRDLEVAPSADFYAAVAAVGASFLQIEDEAFVLV